MAATIYDWSTTAGNNATADADINWSEGQFPSTVNDSARQMMGRQAEWLKDNGVIAAAGTANAIALTATANTTSPVHGMTLAFRAAATNTATATLSINGGAGLALKKAKAGNTEVVNLEATDIVHGGVYLVHYDTGANAGVGAWILLNPVSSYVKTTGGEMTGPLAVQNEVAAKASVMGGTALFRWRDNDHALLAEMWTSTTVDTNVRLRIGSMTGAFLLTETGNIAAPATAPTNAAHLTRKDYVDTGLATKPARSSISTVGLGSGGSLADPFMLRDDGEVCLLQVRYTFTPARQLGSNIMGIGWNGSNPYVNIDNGGYVSELVTGTNLGAQLAVLPTNGLGTYALLYYSGGSVISPGSQNPGSSFSWSSAWGNANIGNPSGSWRCMGYCDGNVQTSRTTLHMRYA